MPAATVRLTFGGSISQPKATEGKDRGLERLVITNHLYLALDEPSKPLDSLFLAVQVKFNLPDKELHGAEPAGPRYFALAAITA